jgi:hypothetical protein
MYPKKSQFMPSKFAGALAQYYSERFERVRVNPPHKKIQTEVWIVSLKDGL